MNILVRVIPALVALSTLLLPRLALAQERQWSLDATDREAFLVFGVPDSDDVGLSFWCSIGSGKAALYLPLAAPILKSGQSTALKVTVDGKSFRLQGKAFKDGAEARMTVEAPFKLTDKLMAALQSGQSLSVTIKSRTDTFPLTDADFEGLVSTCNGVATDGSDN